MAQLSLCLWHLWCDLKNLSYYCSASQTNASHYVASTCLKATSKCSRGIPPFCRWKTCCTKVMIYKAIWWYTQGLKWFLVTCVRQVCTILFFCQHFWLFIFVLISFPISSLFLNIHLIKGVEVTYDRHIFFFHPLTIPVQEAIFFLFWIPKFSFSPSDFHMVLVKSQM